MAVIFPLVMLPYCVLRPHCDDGIIRPLWPTNDDDIMTLFDTWLILFRHLFIPLVETSVTKWYSNPSERGVTFIIINSDQYVVVWYLCQATIIIHALPEEQSPLLRWPMTPAYLCSLFVYCLFDINLRGVMTYMHSLYWTFPPLYTHVVRYGNRRPETVLF